MQTTVPQSPFAAPHSTVRSPEMEWVVVEEMPLVEGTKEFLLEKEAVIAQCQDVVLLNTGESGVVSVTIFRLLFVSQTTKNVVLLGTIPLTAIEKLSPSSQELVHVTGKDMRVIVFDFGRKTEKTRKVLEELRRYTKPTSLKDLYAFRCRSSRIDEKSESKSRLLKEYHRLLKNRFPESPSCEFEVEKDSLANSWWRLSTVNSKYTLCLTYPSQLIVPRSISDDDLVTAAPFRARRRLPVISWCDPGSGAVLARSSQPLVGMGYWGDRNIADEKLVSALCTQAVNDTRSPRKLYIVDARPKVSAVCNRVKGGGTESAVNVNYPKSEVVFLGIENIHIMKDSLSSVRGYVDAHGSITSNRSSSAVSLVRCQSDSGSTWTGRDLSGITQYSSMVGTWLNHIQNILGGASWIAAQIVRSDSVLVHCSDGWDRTTQLIALACLLMDPYYRTFTGFQALVEKDWLAFGHPFAERMGIPTIPKENVPDKGKTSPILLQWVDCIAQLLRVYPSAFEFSSKFLVDFIDCVLSCRFGNFLCQSEREREDARTSSCHCMWKYLADLRACSGSHEHFNPFYDAQGFKGPIVPPPAVLSPTLWLHYHLRWTCPLESQGTGCNSALADLIEPSPQEEKK